MAHVAVSGLRRRGSAHSETRVAREDPPWIRRTIIGFTLLVATVFLAAPLAVLFIEAFRKGAQVYFASFTDPTAWNAIVLTLTVSAVTVPLNAVFGLAAAWCVTRFRFPGRSLLLTLLDLPFAVSPVVAGLMFVLLLGVNGVVFGEHGPFPGWLDDHDIRIIFATPGIVIATTFVTLPFVARELIPLMEQQGHDEELAALSLGASGRKMFRLVTLPNIRWALFYGVVLCNARAMGEFGAVSVVSGHIRNETNTLPLHIEILYNEYNFAASFAIASLLALVALFSLFVKAFVEWRESRAAASE